MFSKPLIDQLVFLLIERSDRIDHVALLLARNAFRILDVMNRLAFGIEQHALKPAP